MSKQQNLFVLYFESNPNVVYIGLTTQTMKYRHAEILRHSRTCKPKMLFTWVNENIGDEPLIIEHIRTLYESEDSRAIRANLIIEYLELGFEVKNSYIGGLTNVAVCIVPKSNIPNKPSLLRKKSKICGHNKSTNTTSIPIHQYDIVGNYIQSFESITSASLHLRKRENSSVISYAAKNGGLGYGFYWGKERLDSVMPQKSRKYYMSKSDIKEAYDLRCIGLSYERIGIKLGFSYVQIAKKIKEYENMDKSI